mgnify:CR=1 FL=1
MQMRRIRIALVGPSGSGKSHFRRILMGEKILRMRATRKTVEREINRKYKTKTKVLGTLGEIDYILKLIDTPGKEEYREERLKAITKICGFIFFYDSTNKESVEQLEKIIKEELEPAKKFKSMIAAVIIGTKKDEGPTKEAINKANELALYLSKYTIKSYGYKVPHLLITTKNREHVDKTLQCIESIIFETKPKQEIIDELGVQEEPPQAPVLIEPLEGLEEISAKAEILTTAQPTIPIEKPPEQPPAPIIEIPREKRIEEIEKKVERKFFKFKLNQNKKMWDLAKILTIIFPDIEWCAILTYKNGTYLISHSENTELTEQQEKTLTNIIEAIAILEEIGNYKTLTITGEKERLIIFKGNAITILKQKQ